MEGQEEKTETMQESVQNAPMQEQTQDETAQPQTEAKKGFFSKIADFYKECVRVFRVTKKPDKQEFMTILKVSAIGILVIGAIGFLVNILQRFFIK